MHRWTPIVLMLVLTPGAYAGRQASSPARAEAAAPALPEALARVLAPPASGPAPEAKALAAALAAQGTPALPALCALLTGELAPPELAYGTTDQAIHPRAVELREQALRAALASFPPEQVAAELAPRALTAELSIRLGCIRLLGSTPCRAAFEALLEAGASLEPIQLMRTYVQVALQDALAEHLRREPSSCSALRARLGVLPPELLPCVAEAAARAPSPQALDVLGDLLGRSGELDARVVRALLACTKDAQVDLDHPLRHELRALLDAPAADSRRAAAGALAQLYDTPSFEGLIALLDDEDVRVQGAARTALGTLAGTTRPMDRQAWREWLDEERRWRAEDAPAAFEALASESPAEVHHALLSLCAHPLYRHEVAEGLRVVFRQGAPDSVREAIGCALALRSPRALTPLVRLWERTEDEGLRAQAGRAIASLSGKPYERAPRRKPGS